MYALAHIGARAGNSVGVIEWDVYADGGEKVTITINDDSDLDNFKMTDHGEGLSFVNYADGNSIIKITGTPISNIGISRLCEVFDTYKTNITLDLTECSISDVLTEVSLHVSKILFASGVVLPSSDVLSTGSNLKYAYSAPSEDNTANLYVGTASSLDDIVELDVEALKTNNTVINLSGDAGGKIKAELIDAGISEDNIKVPVVVDNTTLSTTVENLKTDLAAFIEEYGKVSLKNLIITDGTVTLDVFKYIAKELPDIVKADFTHAKFPEDMHLTDNDNVSVNWEILILPEGTKIAPYFASYPNLKFAVAGAFNKIWLISQKKNATDETSAFDDILSMIPQEIKDKPATDRIGVAFVGNVTVDDVVSVVGMNGPLKNARIWHFYDAKGLTIEDFATKSKLLENLQGNNENPTGLVLVPGADVDKVGYECLGNIYSLSEDEMTITIKVRKTSTFDLARFTTTKTRKAVIVSGDPADFVINHKVPLDEYIVNAIKGTKRAKSIDLSRLDFPKDESGNTQPFGYLLSKVNTGSVEYVRVPNPSGTFDISYYNNTTFGAIARISADGIAVVYQRVPNTLYRNKNYRSDDILSAKRIRYRGMMNMNDINNIFIDNTNECYDLSDISVVKYKDESNRNIPVVNFEDDMVEAIANPDMSHITNDVVRYIAMPQGTILPDADAIKGNCPGLLSMGVMDNATKTFSAYSWKNLDDDGNQISSVRQVTDMFETEGGDELLRNGVETAVMSGYMNADDINVSKTNESFNHGLEGAYGVKNLDLSYAFFLNSNDMVLGNAGIAGNLETVKIPLKMTEIPENFMTGCSRVKELYIPEGYETVGKDAFNGMNLTHIYTDSTKKEDGTESMAGDNGENTVTLPVSLKKICTGAFALSDDVRITDVYVLALTAPECELDAFSSAMYFKNNSYNATIPIHQGSYQSDKDTYVMSVFHFPTECSPSEIKKYTDPTRDYTLGDGLGTTDANGDLIYWPNQSEYNTAYIQAVCGYTWKSWKIERAGWSSEISNVLTPSSTTGAEVLAGNKKEADARYVENNSPEETVFYDPENAEKNVDYRGWHQFVLTSYSHGKEELPTFNFGKINDNSWWTICLPFGLTKTDIEEIYGEGTVVCTLVDVVRNYKRNNITLVFGENLMDSENGDDVIKAGYPYMIKPNIPEGKTPSDFVLSSDKYKPEIPEGEGAAAYKILNKNFDVKAHKEDGTEDAGYTYKFIGSFMKYYVPCYSYFLAWDSKAGRPAYFYQAEMAAKDNRNWNPYTCVIAANWNNIGWVDADPKAGTVAHWNTFTINGENVTCNTEDDSFGTGESAAASKTTNMIFGQGSTTGVNTVHTDNGVTDFANGTVYNLNGQIVSEGGDMSGLGKGIYVVNGKKYVKK